MDMNFGHATALRSWPSPDLLKGLWTTPSRRSTVLPIHITKLVNWLVVNWPKMIEGNAKIIGKSGDTDVRKRLNVKNIECIFSKKRYFITFYMCIGKWDWRITSQSSRQRSIQRHANPHSSPRHRPQPECRQHQKHQPHHQIDNHVILRILDPG